MTRASSTPSAARSDPFAAAPRHPASRPRRTRRGRDRLAGLLRLLVFLLLIFVAVWAGVRVANASSDSSVFEGRRYEVRGGDTLWSIAAGHYGDGIDVRAAIYDIQQKNHLSGGLLQPGQEIVLPYEGDTDRGSAP